jgi:glycosyltransferase involved in cell wall biosynthesis
VHLAIVSPFPPAISGIGQYGYHLTRGLAQTGVFGRITVLAGAQMGAQSPNHLGATAVEYCWEPGSLEARSAILARLRELTPDVVWFNLGASIFGRSPWPNVSGLMSPLLTRRMGYPTVATLHELVELTDLRALNAPGGPFAALGARLLTTITTQADVVCLTMQHYTDWLTRRRVDCVHIPIGAYHEPELLSETPEGNVLFFTTLAPYKGLELLIESFQALRQRHPEAQLCIAGVEHTRFPAYARRLRERFNDSHGVRWLGPVEEDNVRGLFREARLVVLPYSASTGSSSVLYQAATWGRAVVASDIREIRTLAEEINLQVEFFESGSARSLCEALSRLLNSPERRRAQAEHNLTVMQRSRPEEICRQYIRAFNLALEKRNHPKRIPLPSGMPSA